MLTERNTTYQSLIVSQQQSLVSCFGKDSSFFVANFVTVPASPSFPNNLLLFEIIPHLKNKSGYIKRHI